MEARIAEITHILSEATVVSAPKRSNKVNIGSTVIVDMGGKERTFTIVGASPAVANVIRITGFSQIFHLT